MSDAEVKAEAISDLMDGQLEGADFAQTVQHLNESAVARRTWCTYHVVGDVLRSPDLAHNADLAFLSRLRPRLDAEFSAGAPAPAVGGSAAPVSVAIEPAANDANFRWKWMAGVASVVAVASIGWNVLNFGGHGVDSTTLASTTLSAPQATTAGQTVATASFAAVQGDARAVMLRDPRLDQLLQAHRQWGGQSVMPAGFLRNATYETSFEGDVPNAHAQAR